LVHPGSDGVAEWLAGAHRAMGHGGVEEPVHAVHDPRREGRRQGERELGRQPRGQAHRRGDGGVMRRGLLVRPGAWAMATLLAGAAAQAQKNTADGIAEYRKMLEDGNPADLFEAKGEALWKQKRGPKNASLESCDLGKGPG